MNKLATIWTMEYNPFIMGGNVLSPISTEVEILEKKKIKGFEFFSFKTPKGTLRVCEAQTGGIIAKSFDEVKENIKGCSKKELQSQIDSAKPDSLKARKFTNAKFFASYRD